METIKFIAAILAVVFLFYCVLYGTIEVIGSVMNFIENRRAWKELKAKRKEGCGMKVRIKKLSDKAVMPSKAHPTDAGFDLVATRRWFDEYGNICYGTDLAFEIPEGYAGFIYPRSSNSKRQLLLSNCVGIIDSHYRGEVTFKFKPSLALDGEQHIITRLRYDLHNIGDRIGQLIIMPIPNIEFEEADELTETDRGEGGYGSSGR